MESRAQTAVLSQSLAAVSVTMNLSSPKALMNALAAETALVLDELCAHLILAQHIQGVLKFEADALNRFSTPRVSFCLQEMMHFIKPGASNLSGTCTDTLLGVACPNHVCSFLKEWLRRL